ncbi:hypothetical protein [Xylanimonas protaetiae]|uniref:Uncharacterized protein n=1 Tax=Xylanimonas protaetiae TaxID=2509457 RepID=A0A4P6FHB6_9MICO|nr:hypothetical protein [Xylanimonas protaetiae]QAY70018.1 hypothetical protein ET471_08210 [Xylanimonas protaetiae]
MTNLTHIFGASDDLIEVEGEISDELYPRLRDAIPDTVSVGLADGREVLINVEYGYDGIWRLTPTTHVDLVTITAARGDGEPDDVDGCPGYSDKASIAGATSVHLLSQEGAR